MASVNLHSTKQGKLVPFTVTVDQNGEILATRKDETLKFPAGLTPTQFKKLVSEHNKANDGVKELSEAELKAEQAARDKSQELVDSL